MKEILIITGALLIIASALGEFHWYQLLAGGIIFLGGILLSNI